MRDALIGYDPNQTLAAALKKELVSQPWLNLGSIEVRAVSDPKTVQGWVTANTTGQLLVITPNCREITLNAFVRLHEPKKTPGDASGSGKIPPMLYANSFLVVLPLPGVKQHETMPPEEAARLWADRDGTKVRSSLDLGFAEIARMVAFDLTAAAPPGKSLYEAPDDVETRDVQPVSGFLIEEEEGYVVGPGAITDRVWLRLPAGQLASMPK